MKKICVPIDTVVAYVNSVEGIHDWHKYLGGRSIEPWKQKFFSGDYDIGGVNS